MFKLSGKLARHSFAAMSCAILSVLAMCTASCNHNVQETASEKFSSYIRAYTGGVTGDDSTIKIVFTSALRPVNCGEEDVPDVFSFSPSVRGTARWTAPDVLEFFPEKGAFRPGTAYRARFRLDKVAGSIDPELKEFTFSFMVAPKVARFDNMEVTVSEGEEGFASAGFRLILEGSAVGDDAGNMVYAEYCGNAVPLEVTEGETAGTFTVRAAKLERGDRDRTLSVTFRGKDYLKTEKAEAIIPRREGFRVIGSSLKGGADPYISISFSQPLSSTQDLTGIVEIEGTDRHYIETEDNRLKITYGERRGELLTVNIAESLKSSTGEVLGEDVSLEFKEEDLKPAVRLLSGGTILPDSDRLILPFRAVNLRAVDMEIIRIYGDNILMFLQDNSLSGSDNLRRSGRAVYRRTIRLDTDPSKDLHQWQDFSVDLAGLFRQTPGAMYRIILSFRQEYSTYGTDIISGTGDSWLAETGDGGLSEEDEAVWDQPSPYYYRSYYNWDLFNWRETDDPTKPSYYMVSERMPECNLLASDMGIIAKADPDGRLYVNVNRITDTSPVEGAVVTAYNYQLQKIGEGITDGSGMLAMDTDGKAFIVTARSGEDTGYLKVADGYEKSMSRFDTGGETVKDGIKGFVYGERGVWRPGDTLHVTFVADDRENRIPDSHPVTMEMYTPAGQFYSRQVCTGGKDGFYVFDIPTAESDPTGTWNAWFRIGGAAFHKAFPIEAIRPNRLKMNLHLENDVLESGKRATGTFSANWLTGPAASGLNGTIEMSLSGTATAFREYPGYVFNDPTSQFTGNTVTLADLKLDKDGKAALNAGIPEAKNAPGLLKANLICRVEEEGGQESITTVTVPFSPFSAYVGVEIPRTDKEFLVTDTDYGFKVVVVDRTGSPISGHRLEYRIYKTEWRWWWESRSESLDSYVNGNAARPVASGRLVSRTMGITVPFRVNYPEWGRYLVYVKDLDSGHASGGLVNVDWPEWQGRSSRKDPDGLTMLAFSLDRESYRPGEEATVFIPAAKGGLALVSLETGRRVVSRELVKTGETDTPYRFKVTEDMAPNFYVHLTLLQPHNSTGNDLPIRMYGVQYVPVNNPESHLHPQISAPEVIRPQEEFSIRVREKDGKPMTYTLAIVDEGLLDLTAFRTPDPWNTMYAREALGIRTWDLYDDVVGAYSGRFSPLFSIGGDESIIDNSKKDNRFMPVVKFMGPFTLKKGEDVHKVRLPMYVGSVRIMVVAGGNGAYGNAEKAVPVRSPLMVLPTLPRMLGTGEKAVMPVNVFAMEDGISDVKISVRCEGPVKAETTECNLHFSSPGDRIADFSISSGKEEGTARITITAESGSHTVSETVSIAVRNPNPAILSLQRSMVGPGETYEFTYRAGGADEGNSAYLEIAGFPSVDFNRLFLFSENYSHFCTEQLVSRGITMLSVMGMLEKENQDKAKEAVPALLQQLYSRQMPDGGFAYWPGNSHPDEWVTSMAGQFMSDASAKGFEVNTGVMSSWKKFQKKCARNWRNQEAQNLGDLNQAYRLYTLALASDADFGAMNRMKESGALSPQARWRLAAAYAVTGKGNIAKEMTGSLETTVPEYGRTDMTFGSRLRDMSMIMETLLLVGETEKAVFLSREVASLFADYGYTTQTVAFASSAMGRLAEKVSGDAINVNITESRNTENVRSAKPAVTHRLDPSSGMVSVTNLSDAAVYASLTTRSKPEYGEGTEASSSGIMVNVRYLDADGNSVGVESLRQGSEFIAEMTVTNPGSSGDQKDLALVQIVPSGWEIFNSRLFNAEDGTGSVWEHMDIRDDRVCYYFDLPAGSRKTFRTRLRAAYQGSYVIPSVSCEAMYDNSVYARTASGKTLVHE